MINYNTELKFYDLLISGFTNPAIGAITHLLPIPQAVTDTSRVGDTIMVKSMQARFNFHNNVNPVAIVRIIIFQYKPLSLPLVPEILVPGATGGIDNTSSYRVDTKKTYKLIYDRIWFLNGTDANDTTTTTTFIGPVVNFRKFSSPKVQFDGVQTAYSSNGLYMLCVGNGQGSLSGTFRIRYTDS